MERLDPNERCKSCAYNKDGAGAREEVHNRLKAFIAASTCIPFHCHYAPNGRELNWHGSSANYVASRHGRQDIRVCAGWKEMIRRIDHPRNTRIIRRSLGQYSLDCLDAFLAETGKSERQELLQELKRTLSLLKVSRGYRLKVAPSLAAPTLSPKSNQPLYEAVKSPETA